MKKFVSGMLAAVMALSLAACSGNTDTSSAAQDSQAATSEGSASQATIKIGGIGPTTGGNAQYGNAVKNGEKLAVDEINAAAGYTVFELQFEDDESDPETALNAYNALKDWGMQVLVGPVTSDPSLNVASKCVDDNMFMLTPSASAEDVALTGSNIFQMCFTDPNQGVVSANYIKDNNLGSNIGIIYDSSDPYSTGIYTAFMAEAQQLGLNIVVSDASFQADNKSDLSVQVQNCQDAGADLVFLPIYYNEASQVLIAADRIGYDPVFFGCDGMDGILGVEGFDTSLADGLMMLCPFSAFGEDETTTTFVNAYKAAYNDETPNQFAADAYDCVYAIYQALQDGAISADMSSSEMCDALTSAFTTMSFDGTTGVGQTWDENGMISKEPKVYTIESGAYVLAD
ncbi:ABC transporter substrate-binding protein [Subdoligranulum sp. DSM 109015]|uniref:ABC transporter substrate-binding protein n=1 Tax=Gemmiger gallinarum TaxID=2779354 RepID=A0ABR9R040_9FIRM|nr:ABC transporter substrate-binding protein [Gemmiger gallinarum]MBE5036499.1 ABC transporter substrate-binding protein [Gemmiger gallinarum]